MKSHRALFIGFLIGYVFGVAPGCGQVSMTGGVSTTGTVSVGSPQTQASTPTASPTGGTYTSAQTVTLSCATAGCAIYFTTDNSTPTTSSTLYTTPISVGTSMTIKAISTASGYAQSNGMTQVYAINLPTVATPTFSPGSGTYASTQSVTIATTTSGAIIYYTTDGTTPTTSSPIYSAPISVSTPQTVQAIAVASGYLNSAVGSAHYVISSGSIAATPNSISFGSTPVGTTSSPQTVTISNSTSSSASITGAAITGSDASDFAIASTTCSSPLAAGAYCTYSLTYSPTAVENDAAVFGVTVAGIPLSATLSGNGVTATGAITFYPLPGTISPGTAVTLTKNTCTSGQSIFYRLDGNAAETTIASTLYTGPIVVNTSQTITALCGTIGARQSNLQASSTGFQCNTLHGGTYPSGLTCPASGGVVGNPTNVTADFGSTSHITVTAPASSGGQVQLLTHWLYGGSADPSAPRCDSCTEQISDAIITPTANDSVIVANEMDLPQLDLTHLIDRQNGMQCNQQSNKHLWQVDSGDTGGRGWVDTTVACNLAANTAYEIVKRVDHVIGDTGCPGGNGCANYKFICVNGTCSTLAGSYGATQGYASETSGQAWGIQDQIDMLPTGSSAVTAGRNIQAATVALGYGDETAVQSAAYTVSGSAAVPTIAPAAGTYGYMQTPALSDATSGASILYTTDGSAPASSSTITSGGTAYTPATPTYTVTSISDLTTKMSAAAPGNVICISAGTYSMTSNIFLSASGAAGNPIIVESCNGTVVLNYTGSSSGNGLFQSYSGSTWGASYWTFQGLTINAENNMYAGFACTYAHHLKFLYNVIANAGGPGITAVHCDYLDSEHNIVFHSGYNQGWASGIDYGLLGSFDSYTGFHNIMAFNVVSGEYDGSTHHSDGNGFIIDDGGESAPTNDPATLIVGNVGYGNGGRCIATDIGSNIWFVNNTCYANGLDTAQSTNSEFSASSGTGIFLVNNVAYSWNSNAPYWVFGSTTSPTYSSNYYFGGTNSGTGSSGFTSADPKYINPTAVSSPAYTAGTAGQYANTLSAAAMSNSLWIGATSPAIGAGVNPTTLTSNSNLISDITPYLHVDIDGIVRSSPPAVGAYEYQSGTILFGGPFWLPTNTTVKAIGVKSGLSNSSALTSSYSITVP